MTGPKRKYNLGSVAVRTDGAVVVSTNGGREGQKTPSHHAETRVCRKSDRGSVVYVARTLKDGTVALARPCKNCQVVMRNNGIRKAYYTISESEYGVINYD